jgi:tRNA A37 threonylcarbamoyladenosine modification protein TsaB
MADETQLPTPTESNDDIPLRAEGQKALEIIKAQKKEAERQLKALQAQFADVDPEEYRTLKEKAVKAEEEENLKQKKYQELLLKKEAEQTALSQQYQQLQNELKTTKEEQQIKMQQAICKKVGKIITSTLPQKLAV